MLKLLILSALADNYVYLIQFDQNAIVIDPSEPKVVLETLQKENLTLQACLITHHHSDHIGGVAELVAKTGCQVIGPADSRIPHLTKGIKEGETFEFGPLRFSVLEVPGHTRTHIVFYEPKQKWLFAGDTLFGGGCGRLFEGTPEEMYHSLERLAALPEETTVFPGHEYTERNLKCALVMEPNNQAMASRLAKNQFGPSTIRLEKETNPFLRSKSLEEFTRRRQLRDKQ